MNAVGGRRPGSGRKPYPKEKVRVTATFRITSESKEKMAALKKHGLQLGVEIDALIDRLYSEMGLE